MKKSNKKYLSNIIPYLFLLLGAVIIFIFDKSLMIGTDNSFYLDVSFMISRGDQYFRDFYGYRIPIFSSLIAPIFKLNLDPFIIRYLVLVAVNGFYILTINYILTILYNSKKVAFLVSFINLISISSLVFDDGRNYCVPLFHHTLEVITIYMLFISISNLYKNKGEWFCNRNIIIMLVSGMIFCINFLGRQNQIFAPIFLFFSLGFYSYKEHFNSSSYTVNLKVISIFFLGVIISAIVVFMVVFEGELSRLGLLKLWLFDIPTTTVYPVSNSLIGPVKNVIKTILILIPNPRTIDLPIVFITWFFCVLYCFSDLDIKSKKIMSQVLKYFNKYKNHLLFIIITIALAIFDTILTGPGGTRNMVTIFTVYSLILTFLLIRFNWVKRNYYTKIFIIILGLLPFSARFIFAQVASYQVAFSQPYNKIFTNRLSSSINRHIAIEGSDVIILGGQSTVLRNTNYKSFLGLSGIGPNPVLHKIFGHEYLSLVTEELEHVDLAIKLPDFPSLEFFDGDSTNMGLKTIVNYINNYFEPSEVITPQYSFPYNYKNGAIIYKRRIQ